MEREKRQVALTELLAQAESKGYILFDDVMATAENFSLTLPDFDWLTETITSRGILIYDEAPNMPSSDDDDEDDISDFAQVDYESIYSRVVELDPSLEPILSEIRKIKPPQLHEVGQLKYLVKEGKYFCRNWLIQLGMGGADHREIRNALLGHLHGFAAFRTADKMDAHKAKYAEIRRAKRETEEENDHEAD